MFVKNIPRTLKNKYPSLFLKEKDWKPLNIHFNAQVGVTSTDQALKFILILHVKVHLPR